MVFSWVVMCSLPTVSCRNMLLPSLRLKSVGSGQGQARKREGGRVLEQRHDDVWGSGGKASCIIMLGE
jgi:hypothetical protein